LFVFNALQRRWKPRIGLRRYFCLRCENRFPVMKCNTHPLAAPAGSVIRLALITSLAAALFATAARGQIQTAGTLFVNVDATTAPMGNLSAITNSGTMGGLFEARGGGSTIPRVAIAGSAGVRGIQFDGGDYMQHVANVGGGLIPAPAGLVGPDPTRSIEA
jgi:hypothetical protein